MWRNHFIHLRHFYIVHTLNHHIIASAHHILSSLPLYYYFLHTSTELSFGVVTGKLHLFTHTSRRCRLYKQEIQFEIIKWRRLCGSLALLVYFKIRRSKVRHNRIQFRIVITYWNFTLISSNIQLRPALLCKQSLRPVKSLMRHEAHFDN